MVAKHHYISKKQMLGDIPSYGTVHFLFMINSDCREQVIHELETYGKIEYTPFPQTSVLRLEVDDHSRIEEIVDKLYSGEIEGIRTIDILDNDPVYFD